MQGKKSPNNFDDDYEDEYYIDLDESRGDDDDTDEDINDSDYYSAQEYDEGLFIL